MPRARQSRRASAAAGAGRPARSPSAVAAATRTARSGTTDGTANPARHHKRRRVSASRIRTAVRAVVAGARAVEASLLSDTDADDDDPDGDADDDAGSDDRNDTDGFTDVKGGSAQAAAAAAAPATTAAGSGQVPPRVTRARHAEATAAAAAAAAAAEAQRLATAEADAKAARDKHDIVLAQHNAARLKDLSPAAQGKALGPTDRCYVLCALYGCMLDGDTRTTATRRVARWYSMAPATVKRVLDEYDPDEKVLPLLRAGRHVTDKHVRVFLSYRIWKRFGHPGPLQSRSKSAALAHGTNSLLGRKSWLLSSSKHAALTPSRVRYRMWRRI